jgi:hypothetical protein
MLLTAMNHAHIFLSLLLVGLIKTLNYVASVTCYSGSQVQPGGGGFSRFISASTTCC